MTGSVVVVVDAALRPSALEEVVRDYGFEAPSLESGELRRVVGEVCSGCRRGLVGFSGDQGGRPVGVMLYTVGTNGAVAVDFLHVVSDLQTTDLAGEFIRMTVQHLRTLQPPVITMECFIGGTGAQIERELTELGFDHYPRYLMACDLRRRAWLEGELGTGGDDHDVTRGALSEYRLLPWGGASHDDVASLLFRAHATRRERRVGGDTLDGALAEVVGLARSKAFCPDISTLAMVGSNPIGVVMVTEASTEDLVVAEVAVAPEHHGRGVGKAIMCRSLSEGALSEARRAWLVVNAANRPAVNLYRRVGFAVDRPVLNCRWIAPPRP